MRRRKGIGPRKSDSYRGARRNQTLRVDKTTWRGAESEYRPVMNKSKDYEPNGKRECARRCGDLYRATAAKQMAAE